MRSLKSALLKGLGAVLSSIPALNIRADAQPIARELNRQRHTFAVIAGGWAAADGLLAFAKEKAAQLALHSPQAESTLLIVLCDEITRRLVYGLTPAYIIERLGEIETVADLQRAAVLATLAPETLWEETA